MSATARADVVAVGAGLSGLTAARRLTQAGRSVLVLERAGIPAHERVESVVTPSSAVSRPAPVT